jgi:hypothetical protein
MKVLIQIVIGLLVVGCGEVENGAYKHRPKQTDTNEPTPTTKPVRELTAEEKKVVGTYEGKSSATRRSPSGHTIKRVFLDNGIVYVYTNGKKEYEGKWEIVDGLIHSEFNSSGLIEMWRVRRGRVSISCQSTTTRETPEFAQLGTEHLKSFGLVFLKKINVTDNNATKPVRKLTAEEKKIVGTYEGKTVRMALLESGVFEGYTNGKKQVDGKWKIVNGEIHFTDGSVNIDVMRINPDDSLTIIAYIDDGKRKDYPKEMQFTLKKIK